MRLLLLFIIPIGFFLILGINPFALTVSMLRGMFPKWIWLCNRNIHLWTYSREKYKLRFEDKPHLSDHLYTVTLRTCSCCKAKEGTLQRPESRNMKPHWKAWRRVEGDTLHLKRA